MADIRLQNEIAHGKYLAEHGAGEIWNWETPAGRYRWSRRVTMLLAHIKPEMRVLELGCGTGYFTKELAKTGAAITSIDISPDLLTIAQDKIKEANVTFVIENAYQMNFSDDMFDTIVGSSVLHHLDIHKALKECYRVLKTRGSIIFTEPNMMNPQIALQKNLPLVKRRLGDSPDETAFFRWKLSRFIRSVGFREVTIVPFDFLHPQIPKRLIPFIEPVGYLFENLPVVREIAGSLYIRAIK